MAIVKVKPKIGDLACVRYPATLDKRHNPISMMYVDIIEDINKNRDIFIKDSPFFVPEWRMMWFTFGDVVVKNPKFNITKIKNEDYQRITDLKNKLRKKKVYK